MPESEYRNVFEVRPDGSKGPYKTPQSIHDAIGSGDIKRDYSHIRVPVLALLQAPPDHPDPNAVPPKNEEERAAIKAFGDATQAFVDRWRANLLRGVPSARIVRLPGAGHYVFLTREAACIAEIRDFIARLN